MGTITSRRSAIDWLENSFLSVRIKKNAKHYSISDNQVQPDKQLSNFAEAALDVLVQDDLIEEDEDHGIRPTELGEIMSKFCLRHKTFLNLTHMKSNAAMRNVLEIVSGAEEFSTLRLRTGEGMAYKGLNSHPELRFPISGKVIQTWQKVMLLIQAVLGGIPLAEVKVENTNPSMEVNIIWQHLIRICKCLVALVVARHDPAIKSCLEFLRSVTAKAWDDSPWVLRQLDQIGEKSVKRLVESGISTIDTLQNTSNHRVEMILDRNPPFGTRIVRQARSMPKFFCTMETVSETVVPEGVHVCVEISVGLSDTGEPPAWKWKNYTLIATVLVMTNDQEWIEFRTIQAKLLCETKQFTVDCILVKPSQTIVTQVACTQIAGIGSSVRWKPRTLREHYPTPKTITENEAASLEVLDGLDTKDLTMSNTESECEIPDKQSKFKTKNSTQMPRPVRKPEKNPQRSEPTTGALGKKVPASEAREKMGNGRYQCAHRCKGTCHHVCCREGVAKPPKTRGPNKTSSSSSTYSKYLASQNSCRSNPMKTTSITRTSEDWQQIRQAVPAASSTHTNKPQPSVRIKPTKKVRDDKRFDEYDGLPSLKELENMSGKGLKEKRLQNNDDVKEISPTASHSLQIIPRENSRLPEGNNSKAEVRPQGETGQKLGLLSRSTDRQTEPVGLEKFRNSMKKVEDFDERGIFKKRKELPTRPQVEPLNVPEVAELARREPRSRSGSKKFRNSTEKVEHLDEHDILKKRTELPTRPQVDPPNDPEVTELACRESQPRSHSPEISSQPAINSREIVAASRDEDEEDELDEDWDIKIFEGYLDKGSQEAEESTKRDVDQLDKKPAGPTPKKLKTGPTEDRQAPVSENDECWGGRYSTSYQTGGDHDEEYLPASEEDQLPRKSSLTNSRGDVRAHSDKAPDDDDDDDNDELESENSMIAAIDEVLAWAEAHVVDD